MALRNVRLRDFVIVDELDLDLSTGFSVLTGETGAGKSILIDALQLALGSRADPAVVREGASRTEICAEFDSPPVCATWLEQAGFECNEQLLLRRTVDVAGKSRAWINGSAATATQLREVGEMLLDIHGQHAWQSLTRPDSVRDLLDAYAGVDLHPLDQRWQEWRQARKAVAEARAAQETLQRERERLAWQIGEIEKLAPGDHEWDELNASHGRLTNAQSLIEAAQQALEALDGEGAGALAGLARATSLLQNKEHIESEFRGLSEVLASSQAQIEDAVHSLHAYLRRTDPDPERLAALDERLSSWLSLARRYRRPPEELAHWLSIWKSELARLDAAADLDALEAAERAAAQGWSAQARQISAARQKAAPRLARAVTAAMQDLGMRGGRFQVALEPAADPEQAELVNPVFMVAGHPGSTPRPVAKVASGGELSRIALAIAVTTSQLGTAQTLIFDEVDSGVGGAVAETVGRLMKQLGRDRQVLAVTHLPQVAACADHHLVVTKLSRPHGVASRVSTVSGAARVSEVARMLGGERLSDTTLAHARELLAGHASVAHPHTEERA